MFRPVYDGVEKFFYQFVVLFTTNSLVAQSDVHRVVQKFLSIRAKVRKR